MLLGRRLQQRRRERQCWRRPGARLQRPLNAPHKKGGLGAWTRRRRVGASLPGGAVKRSAYTSKSLARLLTSQGDGALEGVL
eukprot:366430-Chlamydomonas_euryale.AAC.17